MAITPHHVPGRAVTVAHELAGPWCTGRRGPDRVGRWGIGPHRVVVPTQKPCVRAKAVVGHDVRPAAGAGFARDEGEDLHDPRGRSRAHVRALRRSRPPRDTGVDSWTAGVHRSTGRRTVSPMRVIDRLGLVSNSTASSGVRLRSQTMSWPESPGAFRSASTIPSSVKPSLRGTAALASVGDVAHDHDDLDFGQS